MTDPQTGHESALRKRRRRRRRRKAIRNKAEPIERPSSGEGGASYSACGHLLAGKDVLEALGIEEARQIGLRAFSTIGLRRCMRRCLVACGWRPGHVGPDVRREGGDACGVGNKCRGGKFVPGTEAETPRCNAPGPKPCRRVLVARCLPMCNPSAPCMSPGRPYVHPAAGCVRVIPTCRNRRDRRVARGHSGNPPTTELGHLTLRFVKGFANRVWPGGRPEQPEPSTSVDWEVSNRVLCDAQVPNQTDKRPAPGNNHVFAGLGAKQTSCRRTLKACSHDHVFLLFAPAASPTANPSSLKAYD